jgi:hypothetical protein
MAETVGATRAAATRETSKAVRMVSCVGWVGGCLCWVVCGECVDCEKGAVGWSAAEDKGHAGGVCVVV